MNKDIILQQVEKVRQVANALKQVVYERDELINGMIIATVSNDGVAVLGPKGTSKTLVGKLWAQYLDPNELFEVTEQPGLNPEYEFGPLDIKHYTSTGEQVRNTKNMMPSKKFVLIDEADKASDAVRFGQFPIIHPEERRFYNISAGIQPAKAKFVYMTMNVLDKRPELEPYFDRIALKYNVSYIADQQIREQYLRQIWSGSIAKHQPDKILGWDIIEQLNSALSIVNPTDETIKTFLKIDQELKAQNVQYSDRKIGWMPRLAGAKALLNKRFEIHPQDLMIGVDLLWESHDDKQIIEDVIMRCIDESIAEARILYNDAIGELNRYIKRTGDAEKRELAFDVNHSLKNICNKLIEVAQQVRSKGKDASQIEIWEKEIRERNKEMMSEVLGFDV